MSNHYHVCVVCESTAIHCSHADCFVPDDWACPTCEAIQMDEFFQQVEAQTRHEEATHEPQ